MKLNEIMKNYMHIPEIKELVEKTMAEIDAIKPVTLPELYDLPEPKDMKTEDLQDLLPRLDKLLGETGEAEPRDENSEAYDLWSENISFIADLYDEVDSELSRRNNQV